MKPEPAKPPLLVCTIGHSTHPLDEFIGILQANEVRHVLDVRTVPRSRHNPQFNADPAAWQPFNRSHESLPSVMLTTMALT